MIDTMRHCLVGRPVALLFGGFPAWVAAEIPRLTRRAEIGGPVECMNYLEYTLDQTTMTWQEWLRDWLAWGACLAVELPLEFTATLQGLGLLVLPTVWSSPGRDSLRHLLADPDLLRNITIRQLALATGLYLIRDYLHLQIGWRIYGLLGQILPRPDRPTKMSVQATDDDDFVDDLSMVGIGRSLGTGTDRRFYGPQSFWGALPIAFPWLSYIIRNNVDKAEIKKETLARCAALESSEPRHEHNEQRVMPHTARRARHIISNLESLGVDVEEDFYVDVDQWSLQIDSIEAEEEAGVIAIPTLDHRATVPHQPLSNVNPEGQHEQTPAPTDPNPTTTNPNDPPSTPTPGIRRAQSLSTPTPRPIRRPTEIDTNDPDANPSTDTLPRQTPVPRTVKRRFRDPYEHRVTRLTTYAVDSLAWHSSTILTGLIVLPVDAVYFRAVAGLVGGESRVNAAGQCLRMLMFGFGVEAVVRGVIWWGGCAVVRGYGRGFRWGEF